MKLTKYKHACFTVEHGGKLLIVDPGGFTTDFIAPSNVAAVVITHQHPDHLDHEQLAEIFDKNDDVVIIGPSDVIDTIEVENKRIAVPGDTMIADSFSLRFYGGEHAVIHPSLASVHNLGVLINDLLYYPGDSFTVPDQAVDTLALPAAAPWMKISESIDFLAAIQPRFAFPTHDAILSDIGKSLVDRLLGTAAAQHSIEYQRLTESIKI